MKVVKAVLGFSIVALAISQAHADGNSFDAAALIQGSVAPVQSLLSELSGGEIEERTDLIRPSANILVAEAASALREAGFEEDAIAVEREWNSLRIEDVGDHAPLSKSLDKIYKTIIERLGPEAASRLNLQDLNTLNYTLPVVFQPRGDRRNGDKWDKAEYRRHFMPFLGIASYWGSYGACYWIATSKMHQDPKRAKKICGNVGKAVKFVMLQFVGVKLSDFIYDKANGIRRNSSFVNEIDFLSLATEQF